MSTPWSFSFFFFLIYMTTPWLSSDTPEKGMGSVEPSLQPLTCFQRVLFATSAVTAVWGRSCVDLCPWLSRWRGHCCGCCPKSRLGQLLSWEYWLCLPGSPFSPSYGLRVALSLERVPWFWCCHASHRCYIIWSTWPTLDFQKVVTRDTLIPGCSTDAVGQCLACTAFRGT